MTWLPISEAPRDGTRVLLWLGPGMRAGYHYANESWRADDDIVDIIWAPTHWMPLPPPPESEK